MNAPALDTPWTAAARALDHISLYVRRAPAEERIETLRAKARGLRQFVDDGYLPPGDVESTFIALIEDFELDEGAVWKIAQQTTLPPDLREDEPGETDEQPPDQERWGAAAAEHARAPFVLVTPPAWRDVPLPPMRWLATNRIPAGDVTILSGDGGGGKTTVALQLAVAVEQGLGDWLGTTCEQGAVIFVSAEETENEMRRRLARAAKMRSLDPDAMNGLHFHFASPENSMLGIAQRDGTMRPTPLFVDLARNAAQIRPVLIIVDSIAGTFGGNQNDRVHARTFVSMFRRLAQDVECAVLLLDHPSLSGITNGTGRGGSMDWQNATRARLHLESVTADDGSRTSVMEVKKSNYGPIGDKTTLRWEEGCLVPEGTGGASSPIRAAAERVVDDLFLSLLDKRNAQGRPVRPSTGRGSAPGEFAAEPEANGTTARAFTAAMTRLFDRKAICVVESGPQSRRVKHIERTCS